MPEDDKARIVVAEDHVLVCGARFPRTLFSTWKGFDEITKIAMHVEPRFTNQELDMLGALVTEGGKNGFAELQLAVKNRA